MQQTRNNSMSLYFKQVFFLPAQVFHRSQESSYKLGTKIIGSSSDATLHARENWPRSLFFPSLFSSMILFSPQLPFFHFDYGKSPCWLSTSSANEANVWLDDDWNNMCVEPPNVPCSNGTTVVAVHEPRGGKWGSRIVIPSYFFVSGCD